MKRVLTIAGSDSSGGAGIQADLRVFTELGVYGLSTVAAVTAQNSKGVQKICKIPPTVVAAQIDSTATDIGVDACKIGMLYAYQLVSLIAERIARRELKNIVLDPVIFAKDGGRLLLAKGVRRMRRELIPKCTIITPNLTEAGELTGKDVLSLNDAKESAKKLYDFGSQYVLVKGGHLSDEPVDLLYDGSAFLEYPGRRIKGKNMHGTGCVLSAAIAARLALGDPVPEAVGHAKDFVTNAIERSVRLGKGEMWYFLHAEADK